MSTKNFHLSLLFYIGTNENMKCCLFFQQHYLVCRFTLLMVLVNLPLHAVISTWLEVSATRVVTRTPLKWNVLLMETGTIRPLFVNQQVTALNKYMFYKSFKYFIYFIEILISCKNRYENRVFCKYF